MKLALVVTFVVGMVAGALLFASSPAVARKPMTAKVMKVRKCDYVVVTNMDGDWIAVTHAGDCGNPDHRLAGTDSVSVGGRGVRALRVTVVK